MTVENCIIKSDSPVQDFTILCIVYTLAIPPPPLLHQLLVFSQPFLVRALSILTSVYCHLSCDQCCVSSTPFLILVSNHLFFICYRHVDLQKSSIILLTGADYLTMVSYYIDLVKTVNCNIDISTSYSKIQEDDNQ